MEYDRIQREKRAEREYLDRVDRQEANGGQAPARPQTISDAWTERQGRRGRRHEPKLRRRGGRGVRGRGRRCSSQDF